MPLLLLLLAACSSVTAPATTGAVDTDRPWPIDAGGESVGDPTHYKGLPLELVRREHPEVTAVDGVIGVVCIGMSNAQQECDHFERGVREIWTDEISPEVRVVNCALGGHAIERWIDPTFDRQLWGRCADLVGTAGLRVDQLRVVLHKAANQFTVDGSGAPLPAYPDPASDFFAFETNLDRFADRLPELMPSVQAVYTTSRTYGGFATRPERGEPLSYEEGHALNRWLGANAEVGGVAHLWGPYIWAPPCETGRTNGTGMCWDREDFQADGIHPAAGARIAIATAWHERLRTAPWYRR